MKELISKGNKRVAFITGGTSGIGAAYAEAFAAKGYNLVLVSLDSPLVTKSLIDSLEERYGITVVMLKANLSSEGDIKMWERFIRTPF